MALNFQTSTREAQNIAGGSTLLVTTYNQIVDLLNHNTKLAHDWSASGTPAYIQESADGNLNSLTFSRQDVSNVVHTLDQVRKLLIGDVPATGDHLGNLMKISNPTSARVRVSN